ncbi:hypothetical protein [Larkinella arboricola]|uniref:hypothetical protein n=1 Tax=Larkinella arboricola TaxID=643671 RepID=UPI000DB90A36|nr:hypothetical protein [Larkinella arboricola]
MSESFTDGKRVAGCQKDKGFFKISISELAEIAFLPLNLGYKMGERINPVSQSLGSTSTGQPGGFLFRSSALFILSRE